MSEPADARIHAALGRLLDLPPSERPAWVLGEFPDNPELRAHLLAAVSDQRDVTLPRVAVTPPSTAEEVIPLRIGRYRVERVLGHGGMGRVFLAQDETVGRFVAIKQLRREFRETELAARVKREAQASGRLQHPNIVMLYHVEEYEGDTCIVMEYVEGRTLFDVIQARERLSLVRKLSIIEQLCAALAHAHQKGVVHRDIKPANVMVDGAGRVKVLDFGIAKALDRDAGPATWVTSEQTVMGTTGYIAPEHLAGAPVTHKADMFAAAVVAYELLAGAAPFGSIPSQIPGRTLRGEVTPMEDHGVTVSAQLEQIVSKGLAVRPEDRFADMTAMRRAFAEGREDLAGAVAPLASAAAETTTSYRVPMAMTAAGLIVGVSLIWTLSGRDAPSPSPADSPVTSNVEQPASETAPRRTAPAGAPMSRPPSATDARAADTHPPPNGPEVNEASTSPTVTGANTPTDGNSRSTVEDDTPRSDDALAPGVADAANNPQAREEGVQRALRAFERAFQDLSTPALRRIHPTVTPQQLAFWDRTFLDSRSYDLRVETDRLTFLSATRVQLNGSITQISVAKSGAPRRVTNLVNIVLEQVDDEWFIVSIRGNGWQ